MATETTVKVTNKDIIVRIPISVAAHAFKHFEDAEGAKITDRAAFAEKFAELIIDDANEIGTPFWGQMADNIFSEMLESGEDFIDFKED